MITLALIGVGKWGENYLKTNLLSNTQIKYICAKHLSSLEHLPSTYKKLTNIKDLYEFTDIDGIIIATPAATHFQIAEELLKKGYNLLIEKPLTLDPAEAHQLLALSQEKSSEVLVGHTQLYNPAYQKCKQLLSNIGSIKKITFQGLSSPPRSDVSVLWDWGSHPAAIFLDLNNYPISKITTKAIENHTLKVDIIFRNLVEAEMDISWYNPEKVRKLIIQGSLSTIILDDTQPKNKIILEKDGRIQHPSYDSKMPLEVELNEFVEAIRANTKINSDLAFGVKVVELLSAVDSTFDDQIT